MKQFDANVTTVMNYLKAEGFSLSVLYTHKQCYKELRVVLAASAESYTPKAAYEWIEACKTSWSYRKYTSYRHCIDQLEDVRNTGTISLDHLSFRKSPYSQLNPLFLSVLDTFIAEQPEADERHRLAGARFLLFLQDKGLHDVSELNYDILLLFHKEDHHKSAKSKDLYEALIRRFLRYLAGKGVCSPGLSPALNKLYIHQIIRLSNEDLCNTSGKTYPPITERIIENFLSKMTDARYCKSVLCSSRHILMLLYIFLDMHQAVLSGVILWRWFDRVKPLLGSNWMQHRRTLCQFLYFMDTGAMLTDVTGDPQSVDRIESLPSWAKGPLLDYLCLLKREGWQPSTISMQRSSNLRFCCFLQDKGINSFSEVTPTVVKEFNLQDKHETPEGKAAYNCRIRSFIIFLYEQGLTKDTHLFKALPTVVSPRLSVAQTLSKEEIECIWSINPDDLSPKALRDYAIVCLGLSMGFRASDITNLFLNSIDWKRRSISIIQQKTGKMLTLPMPVKTGNILFRYLRDGRPRVESPYVFIRHEVPYGRMQRGVCRNALMRFIGTEGDSGRSFHSVRRTFATQLLEGSTKVGLISESLGHSTDSTVHKYLSLDEKRTRMCPLSMSEAGILYEGGAFHA